MKSNFNTVNLTIIGIGVILIICALRGDTPAAFVAPFLGRTDIPKGTLKLDLTSGTSGSAVATDDGAASTKQPTPKPAAPSGGKTTSSKTASLSTTQTITSV